MCDHTCVESRLIDESVSSGLDKSRHEAQFDVVRLQESVPVEFPHFLNVAEAQRRCKRGKENVFTGLHTIVRKWCFSKIRVTVAHLMSTSLKVVSMAQVF